MMKKLLLASAASGLMLSAALAQSPSPSPSSPPAASPPAAQKQDTKPPAPAAQKDAQKQDMSKPSAPAQKDAQKQDMSKPSGTASTASPDQKVVTSQTPDQFLASKFNGTDVVGADDKKIGDVSDVLFDKDGKVLAYVLSIGGFLGIGSKNVAMAPSAFQVVKGKDGNEEKLKIPMSQEQLKQMASFEPYQPPRPATTGAGPGGAGRPTGGTTR
jgi:hypothetical protein